MDEFKLIREMLAPLCTSDGAAGLRNDVAEMRTDGRVVVSVDAIVEGVHFLPSDPIETVAAKLVRVNVSDLIASGARPREAVLALVWPRGREASLLEPFVDRLGDELERWGLALIGGDTTSSDGPFTLSLSVFGVCEGDGPVVRSGACVSDDVWVTGCIGDGWLGLQVGLGEFDQIDSLDDEALLKRYRVPDPPSATFAKIAGSYARASVDVSDGLVRDLGHIAEASGVGVMVNLESVPLSDAGRRWLDRVGYSEIIKLLNGGDDYQSVVVVPVEERSAFSAACQAAGVSVSRIGRVVEGEGVYVLGADGDEVAVPGGWSHRLG